MRNYILNYLAFVGVAIMENIWKYIYVQLFMD